MKKDLQIVRALIKEMVENLEDKKLKAKGKVVKSYGEQNGDGSYPVKYEDDSEDIVYVSTDGWDEINDAAKNNSEGVATKNCCEQCGAPMYEKMCTECGYMEEVSTKKEIETPNPPTDYAGTPAIPGLGPIVHEDHEGTDHEVSMANNSLDSIIWAAGELKKHLQGGERDIPAWIQDHITNAENYIIQAAKNYHEHGSEESEAPDMSLTAGLNEMIKKSGSKYVVYSKKGKKLGSHPSKKKANKQMAAIEISKQGK